MTIELPKERVRQILKMHGLNRITRKRFKKLLMGCRMQRNDAEIVARTFQDSKIKYTPLAVWKVIETINIEVENWIKQMETILIQGGKHNDENNKWNVDQ